jgi:PmbA protein
MEEQVLALARKVAQQAEVYVVSSAETPVNFEANRLKQLQQRQVRGLALRVVVDGRVGLATTNRMEDPEALVSTAVALARYGATARFTLPEASACPDPKVFDPAVAALSVEEMVQAGQGMIDLVRGYDPAILCDAEVRSTVATVTILNSRGAKQSYRKTVMSAGVHGNLVRGTDMLDVYEGVTSCRLDRDLASLARTLIGKMELGKSLATVTTKPMPVILTPKGVAYTLLEPLKMAFSGKSVYQGSSPLSDKLGKAVADPAFGLDEDGTVDWAVGSSPFDDEGVPRRRTPLIEKGIASSFYYDLQTAGLAGTSSTGNGFRSLESLPGPAVASLLVAAGTVSYEDMIADMEEGLVVDQTMGAWAGNLLSGEFSANVHLGFKVEKGRIVGRVKDTMVAGNVFKALQGIAGIGREAEWLGDVRTPALYFKSLGVASK